MRLINTHSRGFEEFQSIDALRYAILSHTWGMDEVTYADYAKADLFTKHGYLKIDYACKQAERDGLEYVWVDTCCIDKSSSAELTEAINSMFAWYHKAEVCYAYLEDVHAGDRSDQEAIKYELWASRWFRRGWTLQELLAPKRVEFYSKEWLWIGDRTTLAGDLVHVTKIEEGVLLGKRPLSSASIAQRMSWAADRETTRIEDIAYCLLGIFDVNMPLLYGEAEKAFIRLQEEILRKSDDQSLFAWQDHSASPPEFSGLLATHPAMFRHSGHLVAVRDWEADYEPTSLTSLGLSVSFVLQVIPDEPHHCWVELACYDPRLGSTIGYGIEIKLRRLGPKSRQYLRIENHQFNHSITPSAPSSNHRPIYIRQTPIIPTERELRHFYKAKCLGFIPPRWNSMVTKLEVKCLYESTLAAYSASATISSIAQAPGSEFHLPLIKPDELACVLLVEGTQTNGGKFWFYLLLGTAHTPQRFRIIAQPLVGYEYERTTAAISAHHWPKLNTVFASSVHPDPLPTPAFCDFEPTACCFRFCIRIDDHILKDLVYRSTDTSTEWGASWTRLKRSLQSLRLHS